MNGAPPLPRALELVLPARRSTLHLATRVARVLGPGDLLVLSGALGSGKTFFVRGLARAFGLPSSEPVTSPTFALVQELPTPSRLVHADLYRLNTPDQVAELGLKNERADGSVLVVEWGEPFIEALGGDALVLTLKRSAEREQEREARITATGPTAVAALEKLAELLPLPPRGKT